MINLNQKLAFGTRIANGTQNWVLSKESFNPGEITDKFQGGDRAKIEESLKRLQANAENDGNEELALGLFAAGEPLDMDESNPTRIGMYTTVGRSGGIKGGPGYVSIKPIDGLLKRLVDRFNQIKNE